MILLPLLALFVFWPDIEGRQYYEALFGLSYLSLILSWQITKKIHWTVGASFSIFTMSALYTFFFPVSYPIPTNPMMIAHGGGEIIYALCTLLFFTFLLLSKNYKFFKSTLSILFWVALLDSVAMIGRFLIIHKDYALLSSDAADACFIVCFLPLCLIPRDCKKCGIPDLSKLCAIPMVIAIMITKSSTAFAAIGICIAFVLLQRMSFKKWVLVMIPITLAVSVLGYFYIGSELLNDNERSHVFKSVFAFYQRFANPWVGIGTGSFTVWGTALQQAEHFGTKDYFNVFIWLHDEPLQILFENGILGLLGVLSVYWVMLKRSWKSEIFPMLCIYGFTALTEMPLRLFVTQLLGVCMMGMVFYGGEARDSVSTESP